MAKIKVVALSAEKMDVEYDKEADVLYLSFSPGTPADDSELTDNGIIIRYKNKKIIGLTVLHLSERRKKKDLS